MKFKNKIEIKLECLVMQYCLVLSAYAARPFSSGIGGSSSGRSVSSTPFEGSSASNWKTRFGASSTGPSFQTFDAHTPFWNRPSVSIADGKKRFGSQSGFDTRTSSSPFVSKPYLAFISAANLNAASRISNVNPSTPSSGVNQYLQSSRPKAEGPSSELNTSPTLPATKVGLSASPNQIGVKHLRQESTLSNENSSSILNTSSIVEAINVGFRAPLNKSGLNQIQPESILNGNRSTFDSNNASTFPPTKFDQNEPFNKSDLNQQGSFLNGKTSSSILKGYTASAVNTHKTLKLQQVLNGRDEKQPNHKKNRLIFIATFILLINLTIAIILFIKLKK